MQRLWVIANEQEAWVPEHCVPELITGSPQQVAFAVPGLANGVTLTGTQTVSF